MEITSCGIKRRLRGLMASMTAKWTIVFTRLEPGTPEIPAIQRSAINMLSQKIKCAVAGALAGAANGFFGAGGGMLLVPLLTRWAKIDERKAYASSVAIILPLCVFSAAVYFFRSDLDLGLAAPYLIGGFIGGAAGGRLFKRVPTGVIRRIFGILVIYGGIRSLL